MTDAKRDANTIEIVDVGDSTFEAVTVLRHMLRLARRGELRGVVVLGEREDGAYIAVMTGTANTAERIGRIELLKVQVIKEATEDMGSEAHEATDD